MNQPSLCLMTDYGNTVICRAIRAFIVQYSCISYNVIGITRRCLATAAMTFIRGVSA